MKKDIKLYFNTANGTWRYRYRKDGKVKDFYSSNPNERKALAEIRQKITRFELGQEVKRVTVDKVIEEFMAYYTPQVGRSRVASMGSFFEALAPIKELPIQDIKKITWQKLLDDTIRGRGLRLGSARQLTSAIVQLCKYSASCGYITDYDVPLFFQYRGYKDKKEKKALTPEQLKKLFEPSEDWYVHAYRFLVLTGLRRGELCALLLNRDFDGEKIEVRENLTCWGERTQGKTKQARRTVYLSQSALHEIYAHLKKREAQGIQSEALFCTANGQTILPDALLTRWKRFRHCLGSNLTLHELRHTHITYTATKSGLELEDLKKLYGHSKSMNTAAVYIHDIEASEEEKKKEIARLKAMAEEIEKSLIKG